MKALEARVHGGRLTLDVATDLPEGAEIDLVVANGDMMICRPKNARRCMRPRERRGLQLRPATPGQPPI